MSDYATALEYLQHFCDGNIDGIAATLADDFSLKGPLFEFQSRSEYITSLQEHPPQKANFKILEAVSDQIQLIFFLRLYKTDEN